MSFLVGMLITHTFAQEFSLNTSNCEKCSENPFTWNVALYPKFERYISSNEKHDVITNVFITKDINSSFRTWNKVKLSNIPAIDKFILVGDAKDNENEAWSIIQNLKTKEFYVISTIAFEYIDYSVTYKDGQKTFINICPKVVSLKEQELLIRFKTLIKSANANIIILKSIQNKYLNRQGEFLTDRVNANDKIIYNKNLYNLKVKYEKITDIEKYDDKDKKTEDKLTMNELGILMNLNDWYSNQFKIE